MEYRLTLRLVDADTYAIDDLLNAISFTENPCGHTNDISAAIYPSIHEPFDGVCPTCAEARTHAFERLGKRLTKAMADSGIDAWNWSLVDKRPPPPQGCDIQLWSKTSYLFKSDIQRFCDGDRIQLVLEPAPAPPDYPTAVATPPSAGPETPPSLATEVPCQSSAIDDDKGDHCLSSSPAQSERHTDPSQASPPQNNHTNAANYKDLAQAFRIKDNEDENVKWFKSRCSNFDRYTAFRDAIRVQGKPGRGNNMHMFDVEAVFCHLLEKFPKHDVLLRKGLHTHFHEVFEKLETYLIDDEKNGRN